MKSLIQSFKKLPLMHKISFLWSALIFGLAAITCYYTDLRSLTIWTTNLWDAWYFTGNPLNFYAYSAENLYMLDHAMVGSDLLIYLPWCIWNLPIWAMQRFGNLAILEHPLMLFYSKCFLIVLLALSCIVIYKIAGLFTSKTEETWQTVLLYSTSLFVLTGIAYIGQNDIIVILCFLWALYQLLKGKTKAFVLFAALSISLKPFFAFSYAAIILYKEKKLHKILLYGLAGISIYVLQKIPFLAVPMYKESLSYGPTSNVFGLLLDATFDISPVGISVFVLSLMIVYFMAYLDNHEADSRERTLYYCALPFICFCAFTTYESYRPIYLFAVFFLLMLTKPAYRRMNLLLEMLVSGCLMVYYMVNDFLFFNGIYIHLPARSAEYDSVYSFFQTNLPNAGLKAFMAAAVFGLICMAVINHPNFKSENKVLCMPEEKYLVLLRSILYSVPLLFAIVLKCFI